jgi:hypothetical protein
MQTPSRGIQTPLIERLFAWIGGVALVVLAVYNIVSVAAEDAVILHQYSRNLAETGVISYIPNGPHAEGATDFLWMVYLALGMKFHLTPGISAAIANIASAFGLAFVLLRMAGVKVRAMTLLAVIGVVALFPQFQAALRGFNVLPFGLMIALTVMFAIEENDAATALSGLILCLTRPDGVVFALPIFVFRLLQSKRRLQTLGMITILYVVPGVAYFLWRWHYFGQFLPLPFLVKSNTQRTWGLFVEGSVYALFPYVLFSLVVVLLVLGRRVFDRQNLHLVLAILVLPTLFYAAMRLDQNLNDRFFFYIPLGVGMLVALNWRVAWYRSRPIVLAISVALYCGLFFLVAARGFAGSITGLSEWRRIESLATDMAQLEPHGKILSTEAGLVPYFSRWNAYDAWGLDTPEFARRVIQPEQVINLHPDVVVLHEVWRTTCVPLAASSPQLERSWPAMTTNMKTGLANMRGNYTIWMLPYWSAEKEKRLVARGEGEDNQCWYVSNDYPARAELKAILQRYGAIAMGANQ